MWEDLKVETMKSAIPLPLHQHELGQLCTPRSFCNAHPPLLYLSSKLTHTHIFLLH